MHFFVAFTHFFRRFFLKNKKLNPQTLSILECMFLTSSYRSTLPHHHMLTCSHADLRMTEGGKARGELQSGERPNLSLFGADPLPLLHSQDSAKNSPTVGTDDLHEQEKEKQKEGEKEKEGEEEKQDRNVIKKVESGDNEDAIVSKLASTTTTSTTAAISTTSTTATISTTPTATISTTTTRKPLPVNEPKPVLPPGKQLRMVSHPLSSVSVSFM